MAVSPMAGGNPADIYRVLLVGASEDDFLILGALLESETRFEVALEWRPQASDLARLNGAERFDMVVIKTARDELPAAPHDGERAQVYYIPEPGHPGGAAGERGTRRPGGPPAGNLAYIRAVSERALALGM